MENLHLCVSLWNYLYYEDPGGLEDVLGEIRAHGFGVELWPAVYSLAPYRPAYHPKFPLKEGFVRLDDLFRAEYRSWLRQALGGMRSCWHSRAFDEQPRPTGLLPPAAKRSTALPFWAAKPFQCTISARS